MSHWAELNSENVVIRVLVGDDNYADEGKAIMESLGGTWVKTSYNTYGGVHKLGGTPLHKNYAGIGYSFDGVGFAEPQPYNSWTLDSQTYLWNAPTPMPVEEGKRFTWDEETLSWLEITE